MTEQQTQFKQKTIVVLCGGTSDEAEVSLISGRAVAEALERLGYRVARVELAAEALPQGLNPQTTLVFPALHGGYGEGGGLQRDLEAAGIAYAGSDAAASTLCMDKVATKRRISGTGFAVAASIAFKAEKPRPAQILWAALAQPTADDDAVAEAEQTAAAPAAGKAGVPLSGTASSAAVLKPRSGGSSVGLFFVDNAQELEQVLPSLPAGEWLLERRIVGREMTLGILDGKAQAIVEIVPEGGVYDFTRKYRAGSTQYLVPASVDEALRARIAAAGESVFAACGCRDFARIDFILDTQGRPYFLEINTLPGLTPTSLLPKSAKALGLDFDALIERMLQPAFVRGGWARQAFLKE